MIAFKIAKREILNNKKHWLFFTINLVIGLLGFTFILLFRENISMALESRAKTLLSSDVAITGRRSMDDVERSKVQAYMNDKIQAQTSLTELYSMGKSIKGETSKSRLVFIKSLSGEYPLRGNILLENEQEVNKSKIQELNSEPFVWISREVRHQFKIDIGDKLKLGKQNFTVNNIIKSDSTSSMRGVSLAPKVYIGLESLKLTKLISVGTVSWYSDFFNLKKNIDIEQVQLDLQNIIIDPAIKVKSPSESSRQFGRVLGYLTDYLGLIGIVALLISTVGSTYLFQSYLFDRIKQIGILKSLGLAQFQIITIFSSLLIFWGAVASILTVLGTSVLMPLALNYLKFWIAGDFDFHITGSLVSVILLVGIGVNLSICFPIIYRVFRNKTADLLVENISGSFYKKDIILYLPALVLLWLLSVWQAHSFIIGSLFMAAILSIFMVTLFCLPYILNLISKSLIGKKLASPFNLSFGHALRIFSRNKVSSILTILCLVIGVTILTVIGQLDKNLKAQLMGDKTPKPSLFLFDIQDEQGASLKEFAAKNDIPLIRPTPMVRARLLKKNGEKIQRMNEEDGFQTREQERKRRFNNRGVNLTYADGLNDSETLIEGRDFSGDYSGEGNAEISIEKRYAKRLGVGIGDTLTYDVLGVEVTGEIVNLRSVNWTSFVPNFFIVFQNGVLNDAPKTFLSVVSKITFERQLEIQDQIIEEFSNVSIINVSEIIGKILELFKVMALAIGIMSFCCILVGLFVLFSILQNQIHKKQYDLALQKVLGMGEKSIFLGILYEYVMIVVITCIVGTVIGTALSLVVSKVFLDGLYVFNGEFTLGLSVSLVLLTVLITSYTFKKSYKKNVKELLIQ